MYHNNHAVANGDSWKIYPQGDAFVLELHSIYGIVELTFSGMVARSQAHTIITTFLNLYAQGPMFECEHE